MNTPSDQTPPPQPPSPPAEPPPAQPPAASAEPSAPPPAPGEPNQPGSSDDRSIALLVHLSGILFNFLVPLIVWLMNKDDASKTYLNEESKKALNFQLTVLIGYVICWVLAVIIIGLALGTLLWIVNIVFCVIAAIKTSSDGSYDYPFSLTLVK